MSCLRFEAGRRARRPARDGRGSRLARVRRWSVGGARLLLHRGTRRDLSYANPAELTINMVSYHMVSSNQLEVMVPDVLVCRKGDIGEGGTRVLKLGWVEIGVIFHKGRYYAYQNMCPHQGGPA